MTGLKSQALSRHALVCLSVSLVFSCRGVDSSPSTDHYWEHPVKVLESCGEQGSVLFRLADCRRHNPFLSEHTDQKRGARWQLVFFSRHYHAALWLESAEGLIWSTPIRYNEFDCESIFPDLGVIDDEGNATSYRLASFEDYRRVLQFDFPLVMKDDRARYFIHGDMEIAGSVVDERKLQFRNPVDEASYWVRCVISL